MNLYLLLAIHFICLIFLGKNLFAIKKQLGFKISFLNLPYILTMLLFSGALILLSIKYFIYFLPFGILMGIFLYKSYPSEIKDPKTKLIRDILSLYAIYCWSEYVIFTLIMYLILKNEYKDSKFRS